MKGRTSGLIRWTSR